MAPGRMAGALYQKILVATDFSPAADYALDEAVRIVHRQGAGTLCVLHVYQPATFPDLARPPFNVPRRNHRTRSEAERKLDRRIQRVWKKNIPVTPILQEGLPDVEIVNVAERECADLVVMGALGMHQRLMLGPVAARVVGNAVCPVLTVRLSRSRGVLRRAC